MRIHLLLILVSNQRMRSFDVWFLSISRNSRLGDVYLCITERATISQVADVVRLNSNLAFQLELGLGIIAGQ